MSLARATHGGRRAPVALLQKLFQGDHLTAWGGRAGPPPHMGLGGTSLLDAVLGERPVPGWGILMAAEGAASQGAGIPWQSGRVPAGDQVFAAEALRPAVELVGGTWGAGRAVQRNTPESPSPSGRPPGRGLCAALGSPKTENFS